MSRTDTSDRITDMAQYVVIGTSPFVDTAVASGPFRSLDRAREASAVLDEKGYVTEVCELFPADEIGTARNDEGAY